MIVKMIAGTTGSGKTTELLKEVEGVTYLYSDEETGIELAFKMVSIYGDSFPHCSLLKPTTTSAKSITDAIRIAGNERKIDTVLIDSTTVDMSNWGVLATVASQAGVTKVCFTQQLRAQFYL